MKYMITGSRIPYEYFVTSGRGESDYGGKGDPYEAGSYDAALNMAKIQNSNIVKYTSVVPKEAKQVSRDKGVKKLHFGNVSECIIAQMNGKKGQTITASVLITRIHDKKGEYIGSFACEYAGNHDSKHALEVLLNDVREMVERRGYGATSPGQEKNMKVKSKVHTDRGFTYEPHIFESQTLKIKHRYGTVLSGLCFVNFLVPVEGNK